MKYLLLLLFLSISCTMITYPDPVESSLSVIVSDKPYQKIDLDIEPYSITSMYAMKSYIEVSILFKDNINNLIIITDDLQMGDTVEITIRYRL